MSVIASMQKTKKSDERTKKKNKFNFCTIFSPAWIDTTRFI